jgi:hypothetical protein
MTAFPSTLQIPWFDWLPQNENHKAHHTTKPASNDISWSVMETGVRLEPHTSHYSPYTYMSVLHCIIGLKYEVQEHGYHMNFVTFANFVYIAFE